MRTTNWYTTLTVSAVLALLPAVAWGDTPPRWEFKVETQTRAKYRLPDGTVTLGHLDMDGSFVRDSTGGVGWVIADNDPATRSIGGIGKNNEFTNFEVVYEFRSGVISPGTLGVSGKFRPTIGGASIWVDDYSPGEGKPRIYNLPGRFVELPPGGVRRKYRDQVEAIDLTARLAAVEARMTGVDNLQLRYRKDLGRVVGLLRGGKVVFGRLDEKGAFAEDRDLPPADYAKKPSSAVRVGGKEVLAPVINHPRSERELVFEYRSESLTAGNLTGEGDFVPVVGAVVISFGWTYQHTQADPRIYNLPGEFVKK